MSIPIEAIRLPPESLGPEQRSLYDTIVYGPRGGAGAPFALTNADGSLRGPFAAMLLAPAIGDPVQKLGSALRFQSSLDARLREVAILVVARELASVFERDAHEAVARRIGMTDGELSAIARNDLGILSSRERQAALLTAALVTGNGTTDVALAEGFSAVELYELTSLAGYYRMLATQLHFFDLDAA